FHWLLETDPAVLTALDPYQGKYNPANWALAESTWFGVPKVGSPTWPKSIWSTCNTKPGWLVFWLPSGTDMLGSRVTYGCTTKVYTWSKFVPAESLKL